MRPDQSKPISQAAFNGLISAMLHGDPQARFAAADAAEKASRTQPDLLMARKTALLGVLLQTGKSGVRWHLLQMLPRLELDACERRLAFETAYRWMEDGGRIVAAEALTAMFLLSRAGGHARPCRGYGTTLAGLTLGSLACKGAQDAGASRCAPLKQVNLFWKSLLVLRSKKNSFLAHDADATWRHLIATARDARMLGRSKQNHTHQPIGNDNTAPANAPGLPKACVRPCKTSQCER